MHTEKANQLVKGKNENSKLFVSILELSGSENAIKRNERWSKMHEIEPDGGFIHYMYAWTIQDRQERINEFEKFLQQEKDDGDNYFHILSRQHFFCSCVPIIFHCSFKSIFSHN